MCPPLFSQVNYVLRLCQTTWCQRSNKDLSSLQNNLERDAKIVQRFYSVVGGDLNSHKIKFFRTEKGWVLPFMVSFWGTNTFKLKIEHLWALWCQPSLKWQEDFRFLLDQYGWQVMEYQRRNQGLIFFLNSSRSLTRIKFYNIWADLAFWEGS